MDIHQNHGAKNVGFIQFASSSIHFAGLLEIARNQYLAQKAIHIAIWGAKTHFPCRMSQNFQSISKNVPRKITKALKIAAPKCEIVNQFRFDPVWVSEMMSSLLPVLTDIKTTDDFARLRIKNLNPGPAIANEFVTLTKSRKSSPAQNFGLICDMLQSYLEVFSATRLWIKQNSINELYLFNGRFLHERAAWDAGRLDEVSVLIFETTRDRLHIRREGFHNRSNNQRIMLEHWENSKDSELLKLEVSDQWFVNLRSDKNPFSTENAKNIEISEPYILYFSNSDDEAVGFWEHWDQNLGPQIECVRKLINLAEAQSEYKLVIRLHPNLASKPPADQQEWFDLTDSKNVKLIGPDDHISSYGLIQGSRAVITFGSTIGIEAAYMAKPVMVLADCKYDELGFAFKPADWDSVRNWINNTKSFSEVELLRNKTLSRVFGYFVFTGGREFEYTNLVETGWGAWKVVDFLGFNWSESSILHLFRRVLMKISLWKKTRVISR